MKKQYLVTVEVAESHPNDAEEIIHAALREQCYIPSVVEIKPRAKKVEATFVCDLCGKESAGVAHAVYNENHAKQHGLKQCSECLAKIEQPW